MPRPHPAPGPVYAIADLASLGATALPDAVAAIAEAGVRWIQVRAKGEIPDAELWPLLAECQRRLAGSGVELWIDDRADLAALLGAHLHLGQTDLPPAAARRVVGKGVWIGLSTHNAAELASAEADPEVDVIAFGPIFPTTSKQRPDPTVGLAALARARQSTTRTLVAIGGIEAGKIREVLGAGADTAAVVGAVCHGEVATNCRRLLAAAGEGRA